MTRTAVRPGFAGFAMLLALVSFGLVMPSPASSGEGRLVVTGRVVGPNHRLPIADARVTLFTPDLSFFEEARTDEHGDYTFAELPSGRYRLGVAARGHAYEERMLELSGSPVAAAFSLAPETERGRWSLIGDIAPVALEGTGSATLLPSGDIFFCHDTKHPVRFDPLGGTTIHPVSPFGQAGGHVSALLTNGEVLLIGGSSTGEPRGGVITRAAKAYRPDGSWRQRAEMQMARWYPSLVRLPHERLLVLGGDDGSGRTNTAEIYDPTTNRWTSSPPFRRPQDMPPALLLHTGEVLKTWSDVELFDPRGATWRDAGQMLQKRSGQREGDHSDHTAVLLPDGKVMAIGILPGAGSTPASMIEIYNPENDRWTLGPSPDVIRGRPDALMLPGGDVLVYGGSYSDHPRPPVPLGAAGAVGDLTKVTDLYNRRTGTWRRMADMKLFTHFHSVGVLHPDGRVIVAGGAGSRGPFGRDMRVQAFEPPYMFRGVRPRIERVSTTDLSPGDSLSLDVSYTDSATEVVLIGARAVTHWIDSGPNRHLSLDFHQDASRIEARVPDDPVLALAGWYLLFVMVDDIPSEGRMVRIIASPGEM